MSSKKILLFIDGLGSGGAERQLVGLAVMLKSQDYDVSVLCYKPEADFYADALINYGIEYVNIHKGPCEGFFSLYRKICKWKPDCIISYLNQSNMLASLCSMITKVPLVVSERNTMNKQRLIDRLRFFLYKWSIAIVSNSYSQTDFVARNYPTYKNKAHTIINFVDTDTFYPAKTLITNSSIITVVARITPQKNVIGLIKCIRNLKERNLLGDIQVHWYGDIGDVNYHQKCKDLINQLDIADEFRFMGVTDNVASLYRRSSVLCLPSFREGTPNVIAEAMACGLPIICSDVCDNGLYVKDAVNGYLVDPNDINSISNGILKYINMTPNEKHKMGKVNRKDALDNFSTEKFVSRYVSLINKIISR